jgi:hypothetical protein
MRFFCRAAATENNRLNSKAYKNGCGWCRHITTNTVADLLPVGKLILAELPRL